MHPYGLSKILGFLCAGNYDMTLYLSYLGLSIAA